MEFTEDARYQAMAEAYALDAIDYARDNMRLTLDWGDRSIEILESILDVFHRGLAEAKPTDEQATHNLPQQAIPRFAEKTAALAFATWEAE